MIVSSEGKAGGPAVSSRGVDASLSDGDDSLAGDWLALDVAAGAMETGSVAGVVTGGSGRLARKKISAAPAA